MRTFPRLHRRTVVPLVAFLLSMSACGDDSQSPDGDEAETKCATADNPQGTQTGTCLCHSADPLDVRIQFANYANVAGIRLAISTPYGSCVIDELPVDDGGGGGLELGQALFPLQAGDAITFVMSGGVNVTGQCVVTADAVQLGYAGASVQPGGMFLCDGFTLVSP